MGRVREGKGRSKGGEREGMFISYQAWDSQIPKKVFFPQNQALFTTSMN